MRAIEPNTTDDAMKAYGNVTIEKKGMLTVVTNTETGFSIKSMVLDSEGSAVSRTISEFNAAEVRTNLKK